MNIYFIYPNDFEPTNFHHLLKMLKVTAIYSLIPKNDRINPDDYLDDELRETISFEDLSYIPFKPQSVYRNSIAKKIVKYFTHQDEFTDYFEAEAEVLGFEDEFLFEDNNTGSSFESLPFSHSKSGDFVGNITQFDDPNLLVLCYRGRPILEIPKLIYDEFHRWMDTHDYEKIIPVIYLQSWAKDPDSNITSVWRRTTKEERKHMSYTIRDAKTHRFRPMTYTEKKRFSYGSFYPVTMNDLGKESKFSYYGIHYDPICYLYKKMFPLSTDDDEMRLKIELAHLLLTEEAQHQMNDKLEELAEERREMEYQEWLHADEIDDTDYDRETYYALGGEDYDRFREEGGNIDDMMDGLGF